MSAMTLDTSNLVMTLVITSDERVGINECQDTRYNQSGNDVGSIER